MKNAAPFHNRTTVLWNCWLILYKSMALREVLAVNQISGLSTKPNSNQMKVPLLNIGKCKIVDVVKTSVWRRLLNNYESVSAFSHGKVFRVEDFERSFRPSPASTKPNIRLLLYFTWSRTFRLFSRPRQRIGRSSEPGSGRWYSHSNPYGHCGPSTQHVQ